MKRRDFVKWNALAAAAACAPVGFDFIQRHRLFRQKAKSVVVLFMTGGPSQIELFDYKPDLYKYNGMSFKDYLAEHQYSDAEVNSARANKILVQPFAPLRQHGQCGQWVSDLLPNMAKLVDEVTFIKTLTTSNQNHLQSQLEFHTGAIFPGNPYVGAWLQSALNRPNNNLPQSFIMTDVLGRARAGELAWQAGSLPNANSKLIFAGVNEGAELLKNVPAKESDATKQFLKSFEQSQQLSPNHPNTKMGDQQRLEDFKMIYSMRENVIDILEMSNLTENEKKLYPVDDEIAGKFAQQLLAARRMIENDVPYVEIYCGSDVTDDLSWDHHERISDTPKMTQKVDSPILGFMTDLKNRGLLDSTIVIWAGEMGRGPTSDPERTKGDLGRPHNDKAGTFWMAGAGIKKGFSFGETDELSYLSVKDQVTMGDVWATVFHLMGINHHDLNYASGEDNRQMRLTRNDSRILYEILS